jgi:hypothetical protein
MMNEKLRRCSNCGRFMNRGYLLGLYYACSDKCRNDIYKKCDGVSTDEEAKILYLKDCYLLSDEDIEGLTSEQISEKFKDCEISDDVFYTEWT